MSPMHPTYEGTFFLIPNSIINIKTQQSTKNTVFIPFPKNIPTCISTSTSLFSTDLEVYNLFLCVDLETKSSI